MRMRFWGENTREIEAVVCKRLWARAFHPKARSHSPITVPEPSKSEFLQWKAHTNTRHIQRRQLLNSPLPAYPTARRISRVMRFAKVKEENAKRAGDT